MLEPSSGQATTSGPGTPLLAGIAGAAALLVVFLIGYQLGSGNATVRTMVIGASASPRAAGPTPQPENPTLIQPARVADELQQAYYANSTLGGWVICEAGVELSCDALRPVPIQADHLFDPPARHWTNLGQAHVAHLTAGSRIYLLGDIAYLDRAWIGPLEAEQSRTYGRVVGVRINDSIQYIDFGALPAGDYVLLSSTVDRRLSLGAGLRVR